MVTSLNKKSNGILIARPVIFRAFLGLFPAVVQRVQDKFGGDYTSANFFDVIAPIFSNLPNSRLEKPGTSWVELRDYFEKRLRSKLMI